MELTEQEAKKMGLRNAADQTNIKSDNFVKIYANNVGIGATNWDMGIVFGEILGIGDEGKPVVEQKVKINMTREFMKALSNLLSANIRAYEEKFGEISLENLFAITEELESKTTVARLPTKKSAVKKKK
jgi:hypothetical protein